MKLLQLATLTLGLGLCASVSAQQPQRDLNKIIPVQRAIVAAREAMRSGDSAKALRILEAEESNGKGNSAFESLLKEARDANKQANPPAGSEIVEPPSRFPSINSPSNSPARLSPPLPPPPPVEDFAKDVGPSPTPGANSTEPKELPVVINPTVVTPPLVKTPRADVDPFQQTPSHGKLPTTEVSRADAAFAAKKYDQAASLYQKASEKGLKISSEQKEQWIYSRLYNVSAELKGGGIEESRAAELRREVSDCRAASSERLLDFCDRLSTALGSVKTAGVTESPVPGVNPPSTVGNFIIKGSIDSAKSAEILEVSNAVRYAMYQRWAGAEANNWSTPCEITLHNCGKDYHSATKKPETLIGHATVAVRGNQVVTRKLDLCSDDPTLLDVTLPNELTQLILMEMYAEQPLPKWALIGMAALSESPESVARYRRAVPGLLQDRKLLQLNVLMDQQTFPESEATTAFYAQSISLVSFLVEKKGCKAFALFMREAPRRGYARVLQTHYGFKDVADLQQQWLKSLSAAR